MDGQGTNPWNDDPAPSSSFSEASAPQMQQEPQEEPDQAILKVRQQMGRGSSMRIGAIVVVVLLVIGAIVLLNGIPKTTGPTTSTTVTTVRLAAVPINGCMNITAPGSYYLSKSIGVSLGSGPCINVKASNVQLIGNQNRITGSGPFVGVAPFTYGIYIGRQRNVTVSGFSLSSFSFGIYLNQTSNSTLVFNNLTKMAMSGIWLNGSSYNLITNNTVSSAASKNGGINLLKSNFNKVIGDVIIGNANYGLVSNSTNNTYQRDVFSNNPVDIYCPFLNTSFKQSNLFGSSLCNTNNYCNFAQCSVKNLPSNISSFILSPPAINSCGGIIYSGKYVLSRDINLKNYLNTSNPLSQRQSCLKITAPNVNINCNGHKISNAPYGINASGQFNTTITNCVFVNNTLAGISANSNFNLKVSNTIVSGSIFGISATNGTIATISNTLSFNNTYGVYVNASGAFSIGNFNSSRNSYGIYLDKVTGVTLSGGNLFSNSKSDIYCTANNYNSTQNQFGSTSCGSSDCLWATSCATKQKPPVSLFPISSCFLITQSGNYSLSGNIIGADKCINIQSSNVNLNCKGYFITGNLGGSAIFVGSGQSNVVVSNCKLNRFQYGIFASNATRLTLQNNLIGTVTSGIMLNNVTNSKLGSNNVSAASGIASYTFNRISNLTVNGNKASATAGFNATNGFSFFNSTNNLISFNNVSNSAGYGFSFANALGNNVFNNSAYTNTKADYFCSNSSSGVYAQNGGVNFGNSKVGCRWMAELNPTTLLNQPCLAISSGTSVRLTSDMVYRFGGTCFSVYNTPPSPVTNSTPRPGTSANSTVINCNYHTVIATKGGTFTNIINSSYVVVENCILKNFTNGILSSAYQPILYNNTIANTANVSIGLYGPSQYARVKYNKLLNSTYGIYMYNAKYATLDRNIVGDASANSIGILNGVGDFVYNTTANRAGNGLVISNATIVALQNNQFLNASAYGVSCMMGANAPLSLNRDLGNNVCSSNKGCTWMSSSAQCAPH